MRTEIELMGPQSVHSGGNHHRLSSAQARVAFAQLVLAGPRGVLRDELGETIWPHAMPTTWASALRSIMSRLRCFVRQWRSEVRDPIFIRCGRYILDLGDASDGEIFVDVQCARQWSSMAATSLAGGDAAEAVLLTEKALHRLRVPFLPEHDGEWVVQQREDLFALHVAALEVGFRASMAAQEHQRAVRMAQEAIEVAPVRESAYRDLMAAHSAMGNRAQAIRAYQQLRRSLSDELGVDPSPETEAAFLELLGPTSPDLRHLPKDSSRPPGGSWSAHTGSDATSAPSAGALQPRNVHPVGATMPLAPGSNQWPGRVEILTAVNLLMEAGVLQPARSSTLKADERLPALQLHHAIAAQVLGVDSRSGPVAGVVHRWPGGVRRARPSPRAGS